VERVPFLPDVVVGARGRRGIRAGPACFQGAASVFFAFLGFDVLATAAQDTRNPQRNIPIGLIATLGISIFLYIAVAAAMIGLVDFHTLNTAAPLTAALGAAGSGLAWLKSYVGICATIGLGTACSARCSHCRACCSAWRATAVAGAMRAPRTAVVVAAGFGIPIAGFLPIKPPRPIDLNRHA